MRQGQALAIDIGRVRIGIAVTDPRGEQALPNCVLTRQGTRQDIAKLLVIAAATGAQAWIVGLPALQEGDATLGTHGLARRFGLALASASPLPVWWVDEANSTVEADDERAALGLRAAQRRRGIDAHAAKIILDRWLAGAPSERAMCPNG